jgi:hypothetical protein
MSSISSLTPLLSSYCTELDDSVTLDESAVFNVSNEEAFGEPAFAEVPKLALEAAVEEEFDAEADAKPTDADLGTQMPVKSSKKTKQVGRALRRISAGVCAG